jgi:hypothetical protein
MTALRLTVAATAASTIGAWAWPARSTAQAFTKEGRTGSAELVYRADRRPPNVPAHYVVTPHGYFDPSCVIEIAEEETVDAEDNIVDPRGFKRPLAICLFPHYSANGKAVQPPFSIEPYISNSWVADIEAWSGATSWISANWQVPNNPPVTNSQTLYYFPGLVPASNEFLLQPVLAWNDPRAPGWTIASWNCCRNGNDLHGSLMSVTSGATLYGYVWGTNCTPGTGVCANWQVLTSAAGGPQSVLNTDSYGQALILTVGGAFEVWAGSSCAEYPNNNAITFSNISVRDATGQSVQPTWGVALYPVDPTCNRNASFTATTATITWASCSPSCGTAACGVRPDGCGGMINCGSCGANQYCGANGYCYCSYPYVNCGDPPPARPQCYRICR